MSRIQQIFHTVLLFSFALVLGGLEQTSIAFASQSTATVQGHGTLNFCTGNDMPPHSCDTSQFIDQISIDAYLDDSGNAYGKVIWTGVYHDVPADFDGFNLPGPGNSGYPWRIDVLELEVNGNNATIEGVVVSSPQAPEDVGTIVSIEVMDGNPDKLGVFGGPLIDVIAGNITVWSTLSQPPLSAGCYDNTGGYVDLWYDGRVNTIENAWNTYSSDGSCTGGRLGPFRTLVIADTKEEADAICTALGGTVGSYNLAGIGYVIPSTAWLCAGAPV